MGLLILASLLLTAISNVSAANISIKNWCTEDVYIFQTNPEVNGNSDSGWTGKSFVDPWIIASSATQLLDFQENNQGTSIKISKGSDFEKGIFQYEYTYAPDGIYWDISDLDGRGPNVVGSPFFNDHVKISPTGPGVGQGTCVSIRCPANTICLDSYQAPDEQKTRWCPHEIETVYIDLCQPSAPFWNKRELSFTA